MTSIQSNSKGVAVITGSAQGIGRSIAIRLAGDGYDIAINDLESNKENLEEVKKEIIAEFPERRVLIVLGNVSVERMSKFVANAGICKSKPLLETTSDDFESVLSINVKGTFYSYKYAAQQMIAQGHASLSAYCASKFAIRGLTQSAAIELGRNGITVNAYAPGTIQTAMLDGLAGSTDYNDVYDEFKRLSSVGDLGTTQDVSSLVSFLVNPEARFITGQTITIDGGIFFD
ncbi:hypothetical protein DFJ58DRAFT_724378 [Suillus subalutaceus]|uniref:uncharacterized protein n=1 Tax=Suillus subalutaceus TaxID=48586 RepID=UPI001B8751EA|nr:uncharacterized protein DFJ58DRAFT_724378 [Suillus subalutaceus]KAG1865482.1 hypothetical protein DFJ58DRAFT_724378 [Suillus subalutaceus]